jgi:hypothetical protein
MLFLESEDFDLGILRTFSHYTPVIVCLQILNPVALLGADNASLNPLHFDP